MFPVPKILVDMPVVRGLCLGLWKFYANTFRHQFSVENRMGLSLLLDRTNAVDRHLLLRGTWEQELVNGLTAHVRRAAARGGRMVFLDIGSHGGLYAILMAREGVFQDIVAFEPDPVNLAQLHGNLFLNGVTKSVRTLEVAASDAKGQAIFNVAVESFRGGSRMDEEGDIALSHQITVQTERVDDLVDESGAILVVKIDVEGHEMKVLEGMTQLLARNSFIMQIESSTPEKLAAVTAFLGRHDIRLDRTLHNDHFFVSGSLTSA